MTRQQKYKIQTIARYIILIAVGLVMIYPMIWMVGASFKATNAEIFGSIGFIPKEFTLDGYKNGWFASTYQFGRYMVNTYKFVIPKEPLFPQPLQHMVFHGFSLRHGASGLH